MLRGALEHQMFEKVREPRMAGRFVGGADLVPDHVGHDRRAVIVYHDDFETVLESEVSDAGFGFGWHGRRGGGEQENGGRQSFPHEQSLRFCPRQHARSTIRLRAAKARRTNPAPDKTDGRQDWRRRPYWAGGVAGVSIMCRCGRLLFRAGFVRMPYGWPATACGNRPVGR